MRKSWKFVNRNSLPYVWLLRLVFIGFVVMTSCTNNEEHKHIPTNKINELDGLVQPTNQTVFSDVKTIKAIKQDIAPILNATGIISYDPLMLNNISSRISGRIEKLYVRFNFEMISKGQRLMDIYSPEILTAQQNLIYLLNNFPNDNTLIISSKQKLQLLGLTDQQIHQIELNRKPINPLPIFSSYSGHIHDIGTSKNTSPTMNTVNSSEMSNSQNSTSPQLQIENLPSSQSSEISIKKGMYIQSSQPIFSVYNVSQVWAMLNIFPDDATFIKEGDKVLITTETNSDKIISSTISYIEPITGQNASAIKARVYIQNAEELNFKIGTLVTARITSSFIKGIWLPRSSVVNLGQKSIVFIKKEDHFVAKTIKIGIVTDSLTQIISGLKEEESVAVNAQFMVDSESFIKTEDNE